MDVTRVSLRPAEPSEAQALTDIALRSKASHGYDEAFMQQAASELAVSRDYVADHHVFVVDEGSAIGGFYALDLTPPRADLDLLFVDPDRHGRGYGRVLFEHAADEARALGCDELMIEADPYAVAFYEALGARQVGEARSPSTGRMLPLLRYGL